MEVDKRQSARKVLRIKAILTVNGASRWTVRTMDIGKYGMCLNDIARPLVPGQEVHVAFEMAFSGKVHNVSVSARVSHCMDTRTDGFKAGLQFIDLDPEVDALLGQYLGV
jgi:hypothetical protein